MALRAAACSAATGDIVAITEDHCLPHQSWYATILKTFAENPNSVVIGGAVINGTDRTIIDRASFLTIFAQFSPTGLSAPAPSISNLAIRRNWLPWQIEPGWLEFEFLPVLTALPGCIRMTKDLIVTHEKSQRPWSTFCVHFHNGRLAGARRLEAGRTNLPGALSTACSVASGHLRQSYFAIRRSGSSRRRAVEQLIPSGTLMITHVLGLAVGLVWGVGSSADRLQ